MRPSTNDLARAVHFSVDIHGLLLLRGMYGNSLLQSRSPHRAHGDVAFSAFTDVMLAIIPIAAFWRLQLKTMTRIGLCLLMGTTMLYVSLFIWIGRIRVNMR